MGNLGNTGIVIGLRNTPANVYSTPNALPQTTNEFRIVNSLANEHDQQQP